MREWCLLSRSAAESEALGTRLGELLVAGQVVWLRGDLGSGKTCLARGVARGLGVAADDPVTSPTYTLMNEYHGRLRLRHFDLYRLGGAAELEEIGFFEALDGTGVTLVEWAERAAAETAPGLHLALEHGAADHLRRIDFTAVGVEAERLLEALAASCAAEQEGR